MILSNAQQVRRVCPYYFDLESVFCSRAGMVPACRTDELFGPNAGSISSIARDMDKEVESVDEDDGAVLDDDAVGESESLTTGTARTPVSRSSAGRQQSTKNHLPMLSLLQRRGQHTVVEYCIQRTTNSIISCLWQLNDQNNLSQRWTMNYPAQLVWSK